MLIKHLFIEASKGDQFSGKIGEEQMKLKTINIFEGNQRLK